MGVLIPRRHGFSLDIKVFLEGPYNGSNMDDDLRSGGDLPTLEQYNTFAEYTLKGGGGEAVDSTVLAITGTRAVIDWIVVELRTGPTTVEESRVGLLLVDGSIVDVDGVSALHFS